MTVSVNEIEHLLYIISKDRSRDFGYFSSLGCAIKHEISDRELGVKIWKMCTIQEMQADCEEYWETFPVGFKEWKLGDFASEFNMVVFRALSRRIGYIVGDTVNEDAFDFDDILERGVTDREVFPYCRTCDINMLRRWARDDNRHEYHKLVVRGITPLIDGNHWEDASGTFMPLYKDHSGIDAGHVKVFKRMEVGTNMIPEEGDLYICSAMGTSKTNSTYHILREADSYIVIGGRTIQDIKYHRALDGSTLYRSRADWQRDEKVVVQFESLHHIQKFDHAVLYIDEGESILRLLTSTTLDKKELKTLSVLLKLLEGCGRIIVMDAFLKKETVMEFLKMRIGREYTVLINQYRMVERNGMTRVYDYSHKEQWVAKILGDRRRKVIVTLSKAIADSLRWELERLGQSVLVITSDSPDYVKNMEPNGEGGWKNYHNVIYTPALANSVSFIEKHFDVKYAYGCKKSASHEDLIQMLGRVRQVTDDSVHLSVDGGFAPDDESTAMYTKFEPMDRELLTEWMKYGSELFEGVTYKPLFVEIWDALHPWIHSAYLRQYTDRALGQRYFKKLLFMVMEETLGWEIVRQYVPEIEGAKLEKALPTINEGDLAVFHHFVEKEWDGAVQVYDRVWDKGQQYAVKFAATLRRGYERLPSGEDDVGKGAQVREYVGKVFELGGMRFQCDC